MGSRWRPAFIVAAACREIEPLGDRGGGESLLATSPLLEEEFMVRGRIDGGDEGGSVLRSGAMLELMGGKRIPPVDYGGVPLFESRPNPERYVLEEGGLGICR